MEASFSKMDLRLGEALTNRKGGKFLPAEPPLRWNTTQWAEILYEPSSFGKGESERVSLVLELTAEMEKIVERLEKQASSLVADKKLEAQLQSCIKQTRSGQSLKLKANMSKVRFWNVDGNKLASPPAELRGRKALVAIEVRQLWIMGQMCGLLMEARDIKRMPLPQSVPCKPAILRHRRKIADSLIGDLPTIL